MQKTNVLILSVLSAVLLCSTFAAFAAADEGAGSLPATTPDVSATTAPDVAIAPPPDAANPNPNGSLDNATQTRIQDDNQTYHILDDQAAPLIAPNPNGEKGNLIVTGAGAGPDYTLPLVAAAIAIAIVVAAVGLVYHRKQSAEATQ